MPPTKRSGDDPQRAHNKGPRVLEEKRVALRDISMLRPHSGWRDPDDAHINELMDTFYGGLYGQNLQGCVCLLKITDMDGRRIIDDGMSTITALKRMGEAYENDAQKTPAGELWPANIVDVFEQGVRVVYHAYEGETDLDIREAWNASKHDQESNKFKKTPVATFLSIANKAFAKNASDWSLASKSLLEIYGTGRQSAV